MLRSTFNELSQTGLDANDTSTVSQALDVRDNDYVAFQVVQNTGGSTYYVVTLQQSADGSNWIDTPITLQGPGIQDNIQITTQWVRLKVTTAEGSPSTINIALQGK